MRHLLFVALAAVLFVASPAAAKKKEGHGKGHHGDHHGKGQRGERASVVEVNVVFSPQQRVVFHEYRDERYRKHCPPGLAKKRNGCQPPGQAKKRYRVGQPIEYPILIAPVPPELEVRIGVPPVGYVYGMLDGDLVKLAAGTLMVVDALDGLTD